MATIAIGGDQRESGRMIMPKRKGVSQKSRPASRQEVSPIYEPVAFPPRRRSLYALAGAALIAAAVFFVYYPSLHGEFILDDGLLLTNNPLIKDPAGLYSFWFSTEPQDYWPMTNTTFWLEWRLWGEHPTGYHVTNLLLHLAACLLIWMILRKLSIPGGFLAALLFAIHPVNVESVAWVAQRKNTLAIVFLLLSILWYLKADMRGEERKGKEGDDRSPMTKDQLPVSQPEPGPGTTRLASSRFYWLSLAAFVLAMFSKGSVAVLPVLLLGIIWWRRPLRRADFWATAPFFVVAAALVGVDVWFQTHGTEVVIRDAGFVERLLGAGTAIWFYLCKAILPIDLAFVYPQWKIDPHGLRWWLPLAAAAIVTVVLWRYRKGWSRPLLFAWGFFCVALLPVLGFTDVGFMQYSLVADHYQHIALIGIAALAAAGFSIYGRRTQGLVGVAVLGSAVVVVGALGFAAWKQNGLYRRAVTLYTDTLEKNPDCWMAHDNLGLALVNEDRLEEAIQHHQAALKLKPDNPTSHLNLGNAVEPGRSYVGGARTFPGGPGAEDRPGESSLRRGRCLDEDGTGSRGDRTLRGSAAAQPRNSFRFTSTLAMPMAKSAVSRRQLRIIKRVWK